MGEEKTGMGR